jgi:hypothetical protein
MTRSSVRCVCSARKWCRGSAISSIAMRTAIQSSPHRRLQPGRVK